MKLKENNESNRILPDLKIKKRTIDKENDFNGHHAFKQLVLKSQRMSQFKNNRKRQVSCNSRKFKSINKEIQSKLLIVHDTINTQNIKPLLQCQNLMPSLLSNLNHKLIQQPNIHLWSKVAKDIQVQNQKNTNIWETLYRNLDTKINGEQCCFKIARRRNNTSIFYFVVIIKFNQKIHASFNEKQWKKIMKIYRTYQQIQEGVCLSADGKISLPLNLDSQAISEHLRIPQSTQNLNNLQFP